nr:putative reverse transcriptase domain-containing protein [Tanacetum cinerariifolium]
EIRQDLKHWEELILKNLFGLRGHRDHLSAYLSHMLYCILAEQQYNLAYFFSRIKNAKATPKSNLPYALKQTHKPQSDHGMQKARHSVSSLSAHRFGSSCHHENAGEEAWYLDDGTIIGDNLVVGKVLELIMKDGPSCGLHLNVDKTKVFWPKEDSKGNVAYGIAFEDALCGFNVKIQTNLLSNPTEIDAPKLMKKVAETYLTHDERLDVYVDLTGSSPLTQTKMADFVSGRTVIDAAQCKRVKYMDKCAAIGYGFLPFSFSSLGELEDDVVALLKRIQKFSMAQDIGARAVVHIFNMITFANVKEVFLYFLLRDHAQLALGSLRVIMEYLVKISKKARILELKQRYLKVTVLTSYTPYPSKKIRRIRAYTSQITTKD